MSAVVAEREYARAQVERRPVVDSRNNICA
jgi:hypothetical protein